MSLAKLSIDMTAKVASFEAELKKSTRIAEQQSAKMQAALGLAQKALAGLGAGLSVKAFADVIKSSAAYSDEMGKLAQRAGDTTEAVSALAYAARLSDVDNNQLAKGLRELGNDAASGGKKLRELGIEITDANGQAKSSSALFSEVADRISRIQDPAQRAAVAAKIFGDRIGPELLPLLNNGADGLAKMTAEAQRMGRVVSEEAAKKAEEFNDNLTRLQESVTGLTHRLGGPLVEALANATTRFLQATAAGDGFFRSLERGLLFNSQANIGQRLKLEDAARDIERLDAELKRLQDRAARGLVPEGSQEEFRMGAVSADLAAALKNFQALAKELEKPLPDPFKPSAAALGNTGGDGKTGGAARLSDADRYLQGLQRQLEATQNLTVQEALLRDIGLGRLGKVSKAQQEELANLAAQIDAAKAQAEADQERLAIRDMLRQRVIDEAAAVDAANASWEALLQTLIADTAEEKTKRLIEQVKVLDEALIMGRISAEQHAEGIGKITERKAEIEKTKDAVDKLNMSFTSAFEDAVVAGKKFQDVLNGIIQDIARMAFRRAVSDPLGNALNSIVGRIFSFDGGGYTGSGPRTGGLDGKGGYLAMLHPQETVVDHTKGQSAGRNVVVNQSFNFNGPADQALVLTAAQMGAAMGRQAIYDDMARGRMG